MIIPDIPGFAYGSLDVSHSSLRSQRLERTTGLVARPAGGHDPRDGRAAIRNDQLFSALRPIEPHRQISLEIGDVDMRSRHGF